ncbi:hypothetical protein ACIBO2_22685 [Nonomuraea sp. NPDC050022]|uniref:hypothetical protein n=1 Tax=unclassified Nonomuraea TaxID=2593643 RepID=UPI0033F52E12
MSTEAARQRLAAAQARLVAALIAGGDVPDGFDPERLGVQAGSLIGKRRSIVARLRPDAARAAGGDLIAEFAAYATAREAPPPGYRADADDFAAWLRDHGRMPETPAQSRRGWMPELLAKIGRGQTHAQAGRGWWSRFRGPRSSRRRGMGLTGRRSSRPRS